VVESKNLDSLETTLAPLSHGTAAKEAFLAFLRTLGKGKARQAFMDAHIVCAPINYSDMRDRFPDDEFNVLQGDIVRTRDAYVLGARQYKNFYYAVATSTCDLVRDRRSTATLLLLEPKRIGDFKSELDFNKEVGDLMSLKSTRYIYLPPLPSQPDVLYNVAHLDRVAQSTNDAVNKAERFASMTLIGWRVFGALLRNIQTRAGEHEPEMRMARQPPSH
jgi:hypothetical protein